MRFRTQHWSQKAMMIAAAMAIGLSAIGTGVYAALGGAPKAAQTGDINLQKGLVGWWKLDGNANDSTPYGHNGTSSNVSSASDRKGRASKAMSFDGSSSEIDTGYTTSLDVFTVSIWVYQTKNGTYQSAISNARDCCGTGYHGFEITTSYTGNNDVFRMWKSDGTQTQISAGTTDLNQWDLFTGTYDGSTMKFYKNGSLIGSTSVSTTIGTSTTTLKIGRMGVSTAGRFGGSLDDARVYNRAITEDEVAALYNSYDTSGKAAQGENGLVGWWKLDGNTKDSSPYGNDGTVTGATLTSDRKGIANSAYSFDGNSQRIEMPSSASSIELNNSMTLSAWIKPSSFHSTGTYPSLRNQIIARDNGSGSFINYELSMQDDTTIVFTKRNNAEGLQSYSYTVPSLLNSWSLLALVIDGTTATLYLNGSAVYTQTIGTITPYGAQTLSIGQGARSLGSYTSFIGSIDDVRIYNRPLSLTELQHQYSAYNSQIGIGGSPGSTVQLGRGLIGDWPLNGNTKDATPYGLNATTSATLTSDRKGRSNSAYNFPSSGYYIGGMGNVSRFNFGSTGNYSISVWVRTSSASSGLLVGKGTWGWNSWGLWMSSADGKVRGEVKGNPNIVQPLSSVINDGQWHMVSETVDRAGNAIVYTDGTLTSSVSTSAISGQTISNSGNFTIGGGGGPGTLVGDVDDARLWNRVLGPEEIAALYMEYR